jgi:hypothetical protein
LDTRRALYWVCVAAYSTSSQTHGDVLTSLNPCVPNQLFPFSVHPIHVRSVISNADSNALQWRSRCHSNETSRQIKPC